MSNIREDIEKIINNHLMKDTAYTLMSNGLKSELETYINKVREENTKEIQERVLDLIFDTRNSQEYVRGFMSCKTYVDGMIFEYLQSIKEKNEKPTNI